MRKTILFGVIIFLVGLISCEKDNVTKQVDSTVYDTIKPLDYFPAYPGSYWIYNSNDTLKVADQYEKCIYNSSGFDGENYDTLILPKLLSNKIYNLGDSSSFVKGYSITKAKNSGYRDPAFKYILSETEGKEFRIGGNWQIHTITGKTIKTDTSIIIGSKQYNNVLITIEFDYGCFLYGNIPVVDSCAYKREYYAKDIGLIKRESTAYLPKAHWSTDFELKEFKINK